MSVEAEIIQLLKVHPKLHHSELQKAIQVSRRTLSVKVRKLLDQGIIQKEIDLTDTRCVIFSLKKNNGDKKMSIDEKEVEKFPYKSEFYHVIKGRTISKRGKWWTAVLLVQSVSNSEKLSIIIQRWQKRNRADPEADGNISSYWAQLKSFTINSTKHWDILKETVEEWLSHGHWRRN